MLLHCLAVKSALGMGPLLTTVWLHLEKRQLFQLAVIQVIHLVHILCSCTACNASTYMYMFAIHAYAFVIARECIGIQIRLVQM